MRGQHAAPLVANLHRIGLEAEKQSYVSVEARRGDAPGSLFRLAPSVDVEETAAAQVQRAHRSAAHRVPAAQYAILSCAQQPLRV